MSIKTYYKWAAVTLVFAVVSFFLTPVFWPFSTTGPQPGSLLPLFIVLQIFDSLAFGLGVAFLAFGYPIVRRSQVGPLLSTLTYISIAWSLVNWWPHVNLHRVNGVNLAGLAAIDLGFHLTLQAAGAILVLFLIRIATLRTIAAPASQEQTSRPGPLRTSAGQGS